MRKDYLERLAQDVQGLVTGFEMQSGTEIGIEVDDARAGRGPDGTGILACSIEPTGATILLPSADYFPDGSVVHEILHARRLLTEGVPRLTDNADFWGWRPELIQSFVDLDNALEHLAIVPEEISLRPERADFWIRVMERVWNKELPANPTADARRWANVHWAFIQFVLPGAPVGGVAARLLDAWQMRDEADRFLAAIRPVLRTKEALVVATFLELGIDRDAALFEYIDVKKRAVSTSSL